MKVQYIDNDEKYISLYSQLFAEAAEYLGKPITDMVTYFSYIEELRKSGHHKFIRLPVTEDYFEIDLDTRKIKVPEAFEANGIGVQGDSMAEILYFKVDRYFDDMDLATCLPTETGDKKGMCFIQWENGRGEQSLDPVQFADIENNSLIFGWPLHEDVMYAFKDNNASGNESTVKFSVRFEYHENEKIDSAIIFSLHTLPQTCKIHKNLIDPKKSIEIEDITDQINKRPAFSKIYDSTLGPKAYILENLADYSNLDIADDGTTITELDEDGNAVLKVVASASGTLKYKWWKMLTNDQGQVVQTIFETDYDDQDTYIATEVGRYMVQVGNEYGPGAIRWNDSNTTEIVWPSKISFVSDLTEKGFADGETPLTVGIKLDTDDRGVTNGTQTYTWYKDDQVIDTQVADAGVYTASYLPSLNVAGTYHVEVSNRFNRKDIVKPIKSKEIILKAPAHQPESVAVTYDTVNNILTAEVTTDFPNDLKYVWRNYNTMSTFGPFDTNEFVPTTNGEYHCEVYQHCFPELGDFALNKSRARSTTDTTAVTNAE